MCVLSSFCFYPLLLVLLLLLFFLPKFRSSKFYIFFFVYYMYAQAVWLLLKPCFSYNIFVVAVASAIFAHFGTSFSANNTQQNVRCFLSPRIFFSFFSLCALLRVCVCVCLEQNEAYLTVNVYCLCLHFTWKCFQQRILMSSLTHSEPCACVCARAFACAYIFENISILGALCFAWLKLNECGKRVLCRRVFYFRIAFGPCQWI